MIKHIVMWRYKNNADIKTARDTLENLRDRIPGLLSLETGADINGSSAAFDLVLITTHSDKAALDAYQEHPLHKEAGKVLTALDSERVVVDFEI